MRPEVDLGGATAKKGALRESRSRHSHDSVRGHDDFPQNMSLRVLLAQPVQARFLLVIMTLPPG
jgi:hypothetical protein